MWKRGKCLYCGLWFKYECGFGKGGTRKYCEEHRTSKSRYRVNREQHNKYYAEYRKTHKVYYTEALKEFLERNPSYLKQKNEERRMNKKEREKDYIRNIDRIHAIKKGEYDICSECGSNKDIELHHLNYDATGNYIVLCRTCHRKIHRKYK